MNSLLFHLKREIICIQQFFQLPIFYLVQIVSNVLQACSQFNNTCVFVILYSNIKHDIFKVNLGVKSEFPCFKEFQKLYYTSMMYYNKPNNLIMNKGLYI